MDIFLFTLFIAVGIFFGRKGLVPAWIARNTGKGLTLSIYLLLFIIGCEVGSYREILSQMGGLGLKAVFLCVGGLAGSALFCRIAGELFRVRH